MVEVWFSFGEIKFTTPQILWLIENLETLKEGNWPTEPRETGYVGGSGNANQQYHAEFENPSMMAAEIDVRLDACDQDGYRDGTLTRRVVADRWDIWSLAILMRIDHRQLQNRINRALRYISGRRRRPYTYHDFCHHRRRRGFYPETIAPTHNLRQ